jgi:unsaturated chondroitin disaccharide hydrolase
LNNPHLSADKIPYWDYDAPGIPNTYCDASAAAIMVTTIHPYKKIREHRLRNSAYTFFANWAAIGENGGFILKCSVANMNANVEAPLPYADYYYLEALLRWDQ